MSEELKPCPFCGGDVELEYNVSDWLIRCKKCDYDFLENTIPRKHAGKEGLVEWWNTRAERTCTPVEDDYGDLNCSRCGGDLYTDFDLVFKKRFSLPFCPNCGAKVVE